MARKNDIQELYISSARKLRSSLPRFVIFLGLPLIVWLLSTNFLFTLSRGIFIGSVEAVRLDFVVVLTAVVVLILASFIEIGHVADACAGLLVSYILNEDDEFDEVRLRKMKRSFRTTFFIAPFLVAFLMFNDYLGKIYPLITTVIPIVIVVWVVIAAVLMSMVMSGEVEQATRSFSKKLENRVRLRRRKK